MTTISQVYSEIGPDAPTWLVNELNVRNTSSHLERGNGTMRLVTKLAGKCLVLLGIGWASLAWGQINPQIKQQLLEESPGVRFYEGETTERAVYGAVLSEGNDAVDSAWNYVNRWQPTFGDDIGTFVLSQNSAGESVHGVMFDRNRGQHKFSTFRFQQVYQGVPVFRGGIGFLVRNEPGFPLVMATAQVREMFESGINVNVVGDPEVNEVMRANVVASMDQSMNDAARLARRKAGAAAPGLQVAEAQFVIWAGSDTAPATPELAISFMASRGAPDTFPDYQKYLYVASVATGEIRLAENQIVHVDVTGTVDGRVTSGNGAAVCDPLTTRRIPYGEVSVVGGNSTFANANGEFTIAHSGSAAVTVRSRLRGQFFEVRDVAQGNAVPQIDTTTTPPGPASFLHNVSGSEFDSANINCYYDSNVVRDYVLAYEPAYPVIANQTFFRVNTNLASTCNAFYDGSSINFYRAGGGCNNTGFSDVVYHEYGHHLINVTGNGQGQMGEGSGDTIGVLIQDDPVLGRGFSGSCGAGIRSAANTIQYPCTSAIHFCGQLLSGCVWDTRNQLVATEPSNYRDIGSSLFLGMLIVRGQMVPNNSTIDPLITILYLELDDDDAYIGNGTPHYNEIATGFGLHNMDAPPLDMLTFTFPAGRPELVSPRGGEMFEVVVNPAAGTPQSGSGTLHVNRGNGFETFPMSLVSGNTYSAVFPTTECGTQVAYYVSAQTTTGATVTNPATAPADFYSALSGDTVAIVFEDNFQTNKNWTTTNSASDGAWERGVPVGGGTRGDPLTDADGSGQCYLTANREGNSDVDNGTVTLTSPVLNGAISGTDELVVSYYRWFSNDQGDGPETDPFIVEVSNNGGSSWTNLETVGPTGPEISGGWYQRSFRVRDTIALTNQMRFRFIASDANPQSVVEAAVDGFELLKVGCQTTTIVNVDDVNVIRGTLSSGSVSDLDNSDDALLCYQAAASLLDRDRKKSVQIVVNGVLPSDDPLGLSIRLESRVSLAGLTQKVELFNFSTQSYEEVDSRNASLNTDSVVELDLNGDISRFVELGSGAVRARLSYSGGSTISRGWSACIDQWIWVSTQ